jgi:3-isopropylmalate dehydrogenase
MRLKIAILAGDGIGPEVTNEAVNILRAVAEFGGHDFSFVPLLLGGVAITATGSPLPTATLDACLESDAVLLGAVGDKKFDALSPDKRPEAGLLQIRHALGGFANLRPSIAYPALSANSPLRPEVTEGVDILFVRELLGGLYFGSPREWNKATGEAWNTMRYTKSEVARVAKVAFELASKRRKKVTSVDKANVLEVSQLWRATVTEVAKDYPSVTLEHQLVDSMAMHLMNIPRNFDVVLTENLFGDILTDEASIITGSLGMLPSATIGGAVNLLRARPRLCSRYCGHRQGQPPRRNPHRRHGPALLRKSGTGRRSHRIRRPQGPRRRQSYRRHRTRQMHPPNTSSPPPRWANSSTRRSLSPSTSASPCTPSNH